MNTTRQYLTRSIRDNTESLAVFLADRGHYPKAHDPRQFRDLRAWIAGEARALRDGLLADKIVAYYDQHLPGWSIHQEGARKGSPIAYHRRAQQCADYFAKHGRYPSKTAKDATARSAGVWLHHRRLGAHGNKDHYASSGERVALLDRLAPGWDTTKSEVWVTRAQEVIEFVYLNLRYPGASGEELRMYEWLYKFDAAVHGIRRGGNPWQVAFMDTHLPGWQTREVPDAQAAAPESLRAVWRAPRQGDIISSGGQPALAIRPNHNPTAPVGARVIEGSIDLDAVPHLVLQPRSAHTVALAQEARRAEDEGRRYPFDSVDQYLRQR